MNKSINILVAIVFAVLIGACKKEKIETVNVMVSIPPQKYFADKIVGDKLNVKCLLKNGGNPEIYEPSPSDIMSMEKCELYLLMGYLPFESSLIEQVHKNNPQMNVVNSSLGVDVLMGTHGNCPHHHHGDCTHDADPHTWTSIKNAKIIAKNIYDAILDIDSLNKDYYAINYNNLQSQLDSMDIAVTEKLNRYKGASFLVWHPSLSYLARDYGLKQISVGQEGKETTIQALQSKIDEANSSGARVFFFQKDYDARQAEVVCNQTGVQLVDINPLNYNWDEEINIIVDAISR